MNKQQLTAHCLSIIESNPLLKVEPKLLQILVGMFYSPEDTSEGMQKSIATILDHYKKSLSGEWRPDTPPKPVIKPKSMIRDWSRTW